LPFSEPGGKNRKKNGKVFVKNYKKKTGVLKKVVEYVIITPKQMAGETSAFCCGWDGRMERYGRVGPDKYNATV
jgi:hypothetical protein